jgi:hypothetical protein
MNNKASLYWLRLPWHTNIFAEGYLGVSLDKDRRFKTHKSKTKNTHLKNAFKKYGESIIQDVILDGDEYYCYIMEALLRPHKNIGWNIAEGGNKPPVSQKGKKIAHDIDKWRLNQRAAKTGKKSSEEMKTKLSSIHKARWADPNIKAKMIAAAHNKAPPPKATKEQRINMCIAQAKARANKPPRKHSESTKFKQAMNKLFFYARKALQT